MYQTSRPNSGAVKPRGVTVNRIVITSINRIAIITINRIAITSINRIVIITMNMFVLRMGSISSGRKERFVAHNGTDHVDVGVFRSFVYTRSHRTTLCVERARVGGDM